MNRHTGSRSLVLPLLVLVALLHFIYPLTLGGSTTALIGYQVLYAMMFAAGILVAHEDRRMLVLTSVVAVVWLAFAVLYALNPDSLWIVQATYVNLLVFQATILWVLLRFIFKAHAITRDVLYAAVTVYILLGALFVPLYGFLEAAQPGSFVDNATGQPVFWQQLIYFSLTTLMTTGYGDILPVHPWARALANVESMLGVLYIAILMARLVGLYAVREGTDR